MCGIAGFFHYKSAQTASLEAVKSVLDSMRYRGPDHLGTYCNGELAMGCVRLAILGIAESGNQPIFNEDMTVVVVYNGEIYNYPEIKNRLVARGHRFSTSTDTEVLVHLYEDYGEEMAAALNGMFAFAVFDILKRRLLLGRDRTAQKPLYVHETRDGVFFASELKAMLGFLESRELDPISVRTFLSMGYVLEPATIVKSVRVAEPGTTLILDRTGVRVRRHWTVPSETKSRIVNINEWKERATDVFRRSVADHLLSDVPVTLFLSGGVDSSLLALFLAQQRRLEIAYTGSFTDAPDHDEYGYASRLGDHCGLEVRRVPLTRAHLAKQLDSYLADLSMPMGDYSGLATYCLAKETAKEFRVALGGDGGDELFGGYPTHTLPALKRYCGWIPLTMIRLAHRLGSCLLNRERYLSLPFKLQQLSLCWNRGVVDAHFAAKNSLPPPLAREILAMPEDEYFPCDTPLAFRRLAEGLFDGIPVKKLCWLDFRTFLGSCTIPKVERNCMRHSLEARFPYLHNEMLNLALNTDANLTVRRLTTKYCLKELLRDMLPADVRPNPIKQGFSPPLYSLLGHELREWRDHWLHTPMPYFKPSSWHEIERWKAAGWDVHRLEWNICILGDWCCRNHIG